jgi:hypothetical protein
LIKRCFVVFVSPLVFVNKDQKVPKRKKNREDMKTTTNLFINAVATAFSEYTAFGAIESQYIKGVGVVCPSG